MAVILFVVFILLILILCHSLAVLFIGFSPAQKVIAWFLIISADVILAMEVAGLCGVFSRTGWILLIQAILTGLALAANQIFKIGFNKISFKSWLNKASFYLQLIKKHKITSIFMVFVSLNMMLLAYCSLRFPQNITDSLYNHMSRIGYWIQQDSLRHYTAFNMVGMTYPYNNSLLISLPIVFLKTDALAGLVQYFGLIVTTVSIYVISRSLGFRRKSSLLAGLLVMTYPIFIYESITSQNDILMTAYIVAAFSLLFSFLHNQKPQFLLLSLLSVALGLGTKQFTALILPVYGVFFLFITIKAKIFNWKNVGRWVGVFLAFFLLVGSYCYLQNWIVLGSPFGPKGFMEETVGFSDLNHLQAGISTNSSRLFAQFISCDGLPPQAATFCISIRQKVLSPILASNIESDQFLYTGTPFRYLRANVYNADEAWYGVISWIILLPTLVYAVLHSIIKRRFPELFLWVGAVSFFFLLQIAKFGWDAYQGRYMMPAVVLLQPLTAWIINSRKVIGRVVSSLVCIGALLIMVYSTVNNASMPLVSKSMLVNVERWGKDHNTLVQKIAYKAKPHIMEEKDVWQMRRIEVMAISDRHYIAPITMVEKYVPLDGALGIVTDTREFPDYLFRGIEVKRVLKNFMPSDPVDLNDSEIKFVLLSPEYKDQVLLDYETIDQSEEWVLLQQKVK